MKLTVASVPLKIAWADPDENLLNTEAVLGRLVAGTDLVVLPELFSTGYIQDRAVITSLAEGIDDRTMRAVAEWARRFNVGIAGSFLCVEGNSLFNRAFFVEPSGERTFYDKRHLFSLSSEHRIFTPGDALPHTIRFRGWNISMIVCYDLRFPAWCRTSKRDAYDVLLVPANWPESRGYAWKQLLSARAIENQAVVVGANRGGRDDYGEYDDLTFIFDGTGHDISRTDKNTGTVYAAVDKDELKAMRKRLPFGDDADDFCFR